MRAQAIRFGLGAAAVLLAAVVYQLQSNQNATGGADPSAVNVGPPVATDATAFAKSLTGTIPSGSVRANQGELVLEPGLIDRFDYYLSTTGERPFEDIKAEVERNLGQELNLNPRAAADALRLFKAYLDFKRAAESLPAIAITQDNALEVARIRTEGALALRARYFNPAEATALFGLSDTLTLDSLARLGIENNRQLSPAQKRLQLVELDAKLPAQVREWRAPQARMDSLAEAENNARARGASDDELLQIRTGIVGAEAAKAMAATDQEDASWQRRLTAYKHDRDRILADVRWSEADRQAEVQRLRERTFNESDRKRLEAFE
jgi:lipase chaperone LimK